MRKLNLKEFTELDNELINKINSLFKVYLKII